MPLGGSHEAERAVAVLVVVPVHQVLDPTPGPRRQNSCRL
jgi:hypothetical protein